MIGSRTKNSHLGDFNFSLEQFQQLLHSIIGGNGSYYHSCGRSKFPIHALPFDIECEWATPTHVYLATRRGTAPRNLKKGEFFLTQRERKVVPIEVIAGRESFAADAHGCIMVRVLGPTEYKVVARLIRRPKAGSPLIVIPTAPSGPSCSKPSRHGLARAKHVERLVRRPTLTAPARDGLALLRVGMKKRAFRSNKETDEKTCVLTNEAPYKRHPLVLTSSNLLSTLHRRFACARLSRPCLPGSSSRLFCNVHHHRLYGLFIVKRFQSGDLSFLLSCLLDRGVFLCSIWNPVSSSRPAVSQKADARRKLSRLAVAPTFPRPLPVARPYLDSSEHGGTLNARASDNALL
jgi:hypothetical protein